MCCSKANQNTFPPLRLISSSLPLDSVTNQRLHKKERKTPFPNSFVIQQAVTALRNQAGRWLHPTRPIFDFILQQHFLKIKSAKQSLRAMRHFVGEEQLDRLVSSYSGIVNNRIRRIEFWEAMLWSLFISVKSEV
ncbi:hypothetical protein AVEN_245244-1 [Araneus ventricosus]|uniref:Uncharacterized protein n=1 Tax=Araneus ventricosus TaxID=182803 RepID=A0A4Y2PP77_ARAVE|nr:hypothetical protein AVEN_245244-1 [Araneus ventricosus]